MNHRIATQSPSEKLDKRAGAASDNAQDRYLGPLLALPSPLLLAVLSFLLVTQRQLEA